MTRIPFLLFQISHLKPNLLSQNYICTYQGITLFNCRFADADKEHNLKKEKNHMFIPSFLHFMCSGIADFSLKICKILIHLCFCDILQAGVLYQHKYVLWPTLK